MGSRKRSAQAKQVAEFKSQLSSDGMGDVFAREEARQEQAAQEAEEAKRWKACGSKNRYESRAEAEAVIADCEAHGQTGLKCYKCSYCKGWHLTSHPWDED